MMNKSLTGGANSKLAPLISFDTIVDTDVGLINLIRYFYLDPTVFDENWFNRPMVKVIADLHYRSQENPLYLISNPNDTRLNKYEILDEYYQEFISTKEVDILKHSVTSGVLNLIDQFNKSGEIKTTILCYTENQRDIIRSEPALAYNTTILFDEIEDMNKYNQFFFKRIEEAEPFKDLKYKTIYFSDFKMNLNESGEDLKEIDLIDQFALNHNAINIFNMYRKDILEK